ncbi:MAG: branched-chain-amino-acid transaminase [Nitrospirae bacterium]|nr:branched-chain-amino-acid transaminase [Nitrospirota bacterium]
MDGEFVPKEEAKISVFDHGLLYGDGVFEGIRCYAGKVFRLTEHLDRLYESAKTIMLQISLSHQEMQKAVLNTLRANKLKDAYIRLVITRGEGDLGLDPGKCKKSRVIIIADKIALYPRELYERGLEIITVPTRSIPAESLNPQVKSLNYLSNILAKIEAINEGAAEALMLNTEGYATECSGDNIFIFKRGRLLTPPTYLGALEGITRNIIMDLAKELGLEVGEGIFTRHELYNAEECFLTGTAAEIIPVVKADKRIIGSGKPGEVTRKLREAFTKLTAREGTPITS